MIQLELVAVRVELPSNTPVVVLKELEGLQRTLSIFIGGPEAAAIAFAMEGVETPRPMTHDLLIDVASELGFVLSCIEITELRDTTYYADLYLSGQLGEYHVSARPSDALALAVRVRCPIYCSEAVLDEAGFIEDELVDPPDPEQSEAIVDEFRNFIEHVSPEDFES